MLPLNFFLLHKSFVSVFFLDTQCKYLIDLLILLDIFTLSIHIELPQFISYSSGFSIQVLVSPQRFGLLGFLSDKLSFSVFSCLFNFKVVVCPVMLSLLMDLRNSVDVLICSTLLLGVLGF